METTLTSEIKEKFSTLPKELRKFIVNESWTTIAESIAEKFNFNPDQTEKLEQETLMVLIGVESVKNFRANLIEELDVTYDQALKVSYEMNNQIFGQVAETLRKMEEGGVENPAPESENVTPPENKIESVLPPEPENVYRPAEIPRPNRPETKPDHLLTDHETMEREEGMHLHSQSVMPSMNSASAPKRETADRPMSIVDQKLRQMVRSNEEVKPVKNTNYENGDPYREPIN